MFIICAFIPSTFPGNFKHFLDGDITDAMGPQTSINSCSFMLIFFLDISHTHTLDTERSSVRGNRLQQLCINI